MITDRSPPAMDCSDAIGVLVVVAVLASISTLVLVAASVLILRKPHLFQQLRLHTQGRAKSRQSSAKSGDTVKTTPEKLGTASQLELSSLSLAATPTPLSPIQEVCEPRLSPRSAQLVDQATQTETERKGQLGPGVGSAPTTPESIEPRLRKRSRVSLSSLTSSISMKLGIPPRRVSSAGHTVEETMDLVREKSPPSDDDELFNSNYQPAMVSEQRGGGPVVLDLNFESSESTV